MAITPSGSITPVNGTANTPTIDISALPTGDLVVVPLDFQQNTTGTVTITPPSGWAQFTAGSIKSGNGLSHQTHEVYRRVKQSGDTTFTWTLSEARPHAIGATAYAGVDPSAPEDVAPSSVTGNGTSVVLPGINTVTNGAMLVATVGNINGGTGIAPPDGFTERWDNATNRRLNLADLVQATAGPSGAKTATLEAARTYTGFLIALRPAGTGGGAQTLTPSLLSNGQAFPAPALTPGAVALLPSLLGNSQAFPAPTVANAGGGAQAVSPGLVVNPSSVFAPAVAPGAVTVTPGLPAGAAAFYLPGFTFGSVSITPGLLSGTSAVFGPTVAEPGVTTPRVTRMRAGRGPLTVLRSAEARAILRGRRPQRTLRGDQ